MGNCLWWEECENDYEKMVYLIKNMHKMDKTSKAYQSGEYDEFFNAAELNNLVEEDFVAYSQSYAKMAETERAIEYTAAESYANGFSKGESVGFSKGESVGFSKGESVGFIAGVRKIAKNMKDKGFSVEEISETTGLSIAEINSL